MPSPSACALCKLRVVDNRKPDQYTLPPQSSSAKPPSPCPVCLGILQQPVLNAAVAAVAALLPTITHASRFKITATLPPSASLIRHRAFRLSHDYNCDPVTLREAVKWTLCPLLESLGLTYSPDAELFVNLTYSHPQTASELEPFVDYQRQQKQNRQHSRKRPRNAESIDSNTTIARILDSLPASDLRQLVTVPPSPISTFASVTASLSTVSVLFAGNYQKHSRIISQTPWFLDHAPNSPRSAPNHKSQHDQEQLPRATKTQLSVEQAVVAGILQVLKPEKTTFTAGGREDVDVRMLGNGRPFVVEVVNPNIVPSLITHRMVTEMASLSNKVTPAIKVENLRLVPRDYFTEMRQYESEKRKHYRCVIWIASPHSLDTLKTKLELEQGFALNQKTPLRVLHRRTQMLRKRHIYESNVVRLINPNFFVLDLTAEAGTYIKEFVHGDNGRTVPNVAHLLGCDADILQLDVAGISRGDV